MRKTFAMISLLLGGCSLQAQEKIMLLVGTYTGNGSKGIYSFTFDQATGKAEALDSLAMRNPSFLTLSTDGRTAYVVSETADEQASLNIVDVKSNGSMRLLTTTPTAGADPCYVATNGRIAVTANYSGGSMSAFRLSADGRQASLATRFLGNIGGPDASRQAAPHVHCACFTPDGRYVLATDFSADRILSFSLRGQTVVANGTAARVSPDSGPRHLVFSNDGRFAYLMSELSGRVTAFRYSDGRLQQIQEIVSDSAGARGGADVHISPDGRFLYSSNRLRDEGIAIFAVDTSSGLLTRIAYQPTGAHPRQFSITPNGRFLLCCCRDSDKIQVFSRDARTGLLTDTHQDIHVRQAVCAAFAAPR